MTELLEGVKPVWESDRYDLPLGGHAWYNGDYGVFKIANHAAVLGGNHAEPLYGFFRAQTPADAIKLLATRQLFEDMVGHHCTYRVQHAHYDADEAVDFRGFYGINGAAKHPYVAAAKEEDASVEFVGNFHMPRPYRYVRKVAA